MLNFDWFDPLLLDLPITLLGMAMGVFWNPTHDRNFVLIIVCTYE